jgi:ketol-acid reductoisomerase
VAPAQKRTLITTLSAARATATAIPRISAAPVQKRGVKTIDFAGVKEEVYGRLIHSFRGPGAFFENGNADLFGFRAGGLAEREASCEPPYQPLCSRGSKPPYYYLVVKVD